MAAVETEAINRRVDLQVARREVTALAKSLRLTEATRNMSMLRLAGLFNTEPANPLTNTSTEINRAGGALDIDSPIFDTGEARGRARRETGRRVKPACVRSTASQIGRSCPRDSGLPSKKKGFDIMQPLNRRPAIRAGTAFALPPVSPPPSAPPRRGRSP